MSSELDGCPSRVSFWLASLVDVDGVLGFVSALGEVSVLCVDGVSPTSVSVEESESEARVLASSSTSALRERNLSVMEHDEASGELEDMMSTAKT